MNRDHLPIYVHTSVLGVDIGVWQRDREGDVDVEAYGSDVYSTVPTEVKRDLSAWARRNLFGDE